jgi:hypothetical protein
MSSDNPDNLKLSKEKDDKIRKLLHCPICHDILLDPVTLYCQHTYCLECLEEFEENSSVKCPNKKCQSKVFLAPSHNYKIKEIIEKMFSQKELDTRKEKQKKKSDNPEKNIKRQIRKEVWHNVINSQISNQNAGNNNGNFIFPMNLYN